MGTGTESSKRCLLKKERKKVKGWGEKGRKKEGKEREGNAKSKIEILHYCSRSCVNE